jgi:hypothetical protein
MHGAAARSRSRLESKLREVGQLETLVPAPVLENALAMEDDLARARQVLHAAWHEMKGPGSPAGLRNAGPPLVRADAFFDLASFVEAARERAGRLGIAVGRDEQFGFSAYAAEGPEEGVIPAVMRQKFVIQDLIDALFESRPQRLIAIQREPAFGPDSRESVVRGASGSGAKERSSPDFFQIDPQLSARKTGLVTAMAFRVVFVGRTESLRAFLNRLAATEEGLAVRCVEIEPLASGDEASGGPAASLPGFVVLSEEEGDGKDSDVLLVSPTSSKFAVTVEHIELEAGGEAARFVAAADRAG